MSEQFSIHAPLTAAQWRAITESTSFDTTARHELDELLQPRRGKRSRPVQPSMLEAAKTWAVARSVADQLADAAALLAVPSAEAGEAALDQPRQATSAASRPDGGVAAGPGPASTATTRDASSPTSKGSLSPPSEVAQEAAMAAAAAERTIEEAVSAAANGDVTTRAAARAGEAARKAAARVTAALEAAEAAARTRVADEAATTPVRRAERGAGGSTTVQGAARPTPDLLAMARTARALAGLASARTTFAATIHRARTRSDEDPSRHHEAARAALAEAEGRLDALSRTLPDLNTCRAERAFVDDSRSKRLSTKHVERGAPAKSALWSTSDQAVGLAFSGGGTRSATFCLGVAQVLAREGIWRHVDYISTVSGGSYMGAHLTTRVAELGVDGLCDRLKHTPGKPEHEDLRARRHHASYLSPDGSPLFVFEVVGLLARGIAANLAVFFPFLVWMTFWISTFSGPHINVLLTRSNGEIGPYEVLDLYWCTLALLGLGVTATIFMLFATRLSRRSSVEGVDRFRRFEAFVWLATLAVFCAETIPALVVAYRWAALRLELNKHSDVLLAKSMIGGLLSLSPYFLTGALIGLVRPLVLRLVMLSLGLLAPCVFVWTLVATIAYVTSQVASPTMCVTLAGPSYDAGAIRIFHCLGVAAGFLTFVGWLVTQLWYTTRTRSLEPQTSGGAQLVAFLPLCLVWVLCSGFHIVLGRAPVLEWLRSTAGVGSVPLPLLALPESWRLGLAIAALVIFWCAFLLIDANQSSLLWFYRSRLERAFVPRSGTRPALLSELEGRGAPLLIVNAAVNVTAEAKTAGRGSDFFSFTPHVVGSDVTGYTSTGHMERVDPRLELSTIVAVSGAAVSPNMGVLTSRPLAVLMSVLGLRLCYWLPNPRRVTAIEGDERWSRHLPGRIYLVRELLGKLSAKHPFVNVSDGGHIENLGVRELLRRRCRLIIACDAEQDSGQSCAALATLVRYARIDWGIDIQIDPAELHVDADGRARTHAVIGKVLYPNEEVGHLIYLKASLTGDENLYIKDYARTRPAFPHETTMDQFFDEQQFEAYRALGHHIAEEVFKGLRPTSQGADTRWTQARFIDDCVEHATDRLRGGTGREPEFVELQRELAAIERELGSPEHREYASQLFPELLATSTGRVLPISCAGLSLCNRQLQFMENVFLTLKLDDQRQRDHALNRGWLNLFRRWARAPWFRLAFAVGYPMYSAAFEKFCHGVDPTLGELESLYEKNDRRRRPGMSKIAFSEAAPKDVERVRHEWETCLPPAKHPDDVQTKAATLVLAPHRFPLGFLVLGRGDAQRTLYFAYVEPPLRSARVLERILGAYEEDSEERFDWVDAGIPKGEKLGLRALLDRAWGPPRSS